MKQFRVEFVPRTDCHIEGWIAAGAIVGAAALGAGATMIAGNQAAKATEGATNAAINEQSQALQQQAALSAPYRQLGQSAIPQYQALLGIGPQGAAGEQAALAATPGYQFTQQQGIQATEAAASAMGLGLSGNTLQGLDQFNTGLADQTYQQAVNNAQTAVGMGQAAAAGQAQNVGNAANNISGALINQGNTIAGIDANEAAGITKAIGGGATNALTAYTLNNLNNPGFTAGDFATYAAGNSPTLSSGDYTINTPGVPS